MSRELARNCGLEHYASRRPSKLDSQDITWRIVLTLLNWKWSPTLVRMYPNDSPRQVSHETICTVIYAHPYGEPHSELIACLRHDRSDRIPRNQGKDRRGQIPDMFSIHMRPPEVDDRVTPSAVGVLVERSGRLVLPARMVDATVNSALAGLYARTAPDVRSGQGNACHDKLAAATAVKVYFCDTHNPSKRGTCENTNGVLRQYLPKGTGLSVHSQDELDAISESLKVDLVPHTRFTRRLKSSRECSHHLLAPMLPSTDCVALHLKPPNGICLDGSRTPRQSFLPSNTLGTPTRLNWRFEPGASCAPLRRRALPQSGRW